MNNDIFNKPHLLKNKTIGVWGLGIAGTSIVTYLLSQHLQLRCMDSKLPLGSTLELLKKNAIPFVHQTDQETIFKFLQENDYIIASPGLDRRPYAQFDHKFIAEIDLFALYCTRPIIAITGSIGKTSVTHLLDFILKNNGINVVTGGNIGPGMFDLLPEQNDADYILLELSSFQLEYSQYFTPTIAVITNIFENHLDRHGTLKNYCAAKFNIFKRQTKNNWLILPQTVKKIIEDLGVTIPQINTIITNTNNGSTHANYCNWLHSSLQATINQQTTILSKNAFPLITFDDNWLIITSIALLIGIAPQNFITCLATAWIPEHRLEKIATINNVEIYNDSKSTIAQATLAAITLLGPAPLYVIIGGVSKGVERSFMFEQLPSYIKNIICFGDEAEFLQKKAQQAGFITTKTFTTLKQAVHYSLENALPYEKILFSPGGASFDLFSNYQERGNYFKQLIQEFQHKNK